MTSPRDAILAAEMRATLRPGSGERFNGWGVMGLSFSGGDVLATLCFPAVSIGPGYSSVWHRDPDGNWSFYSDGPPETSCTRYFGFASGDTRRCPVIHTWTAADTLHVDVPEA